MLHHYVRTHPALLVAGFGNARRIRYYHSPSRAKPFATTGSSFLVGISQICTLPGTLVICRSHSRPQNIGEPPAVPPNVELFFGKCSCGIGVYRPCVLVRQ